MRRAAGFLALQALGLALCAPQAQPAPGNQPGQPPELPRPGLVPPRAPGLFELPPVPEPAAPQATPSAPQITLRRVEISGNTVVPTADLQAAAAPLLERPVGDAEIEQLRQQLTRLYVERGYVSSGVVLRSVDAAAGVVRFEAVEGRLTGVELSGMERLHADYLRRQLQRAGDGPLNLDVLRERFQLLLADPLFIRLQARLVPGAAPGEAVLVVDVERARPWDLALFANNHRPVSTGAAAAGVSGTVRNLTGWGDVLEATLQTPVEHRSDLRSTLAWRMPLGRAGTQLHLGYDHGDSSLVAEPVRALDIRSRLTSREVGLSHTLHETLGRRFSLGVSRVWRDNRTTLLGEPFSFVQGEPTGETRERLWRFWQEGVLRSEVQVLALRSTFAWGRNNVQDLPELPAAGRFPSSYRVWLGQAQYVRQLRPDGTQLVLRGSVQRSGQRLLALDGMALGGVATVRGYRENQIVRDQGQVLSVELEWPLLRDAERGLRIVAVPFFDIGRGRNHGERATTLKSVGLSTRLAWDRLSADLTLARRLGQPAETRDQGSNLQDQGVHLQVSYRF